MSALDLILAEMLNRDGEVRRLFLREHRVMARIGVYDNERQAPQALVINVDLWLQQPDRALEDDLVNVLDYDFVRAGIAKLVAERHWNLQESLCHAILDFCMAPAQVLAARVSTEKPDIYADSAAVGYEAVRVKVARPIPAR